MKYLFSILIIASLMPSVQAQYHKSLVGQPFSDEVLSSVLYTADGKTTDLKTVLEGLKGNIILIDFWASWCNTCAREMPYTKELQKAYKGKNVVFLFLSTDTDYKQWIRGLGNINIEGHHYRIKKESKPAIKKFLKIRGIPYYVLLDKENLIYDPKAKWPHLEKLKSAIDLALKLDVR